MTGRPGHGVGIVSRRTPRQPAAPGARGQVLIEGRQVGRPARARLPLGVNVELEGPYGTDELGAVGATASRPGDDERGLVPIRRSAP